MKRCNYCRIVQFVAFWGPQREATWKRPVLFICSLALVGVFAFATWVQLGQGESKVFVVLSVLLAALGFLGVLVALKGCNACVARLFGRV
jgi:hypothetical protein